MNKSLSVCHVLETSGGGSGQVVLDLVRAGAEAGDDITVIYSSTRAEERFVNALTKLKGKIRIFSTPMERKVGLHDVAALWRLWLLLRKVGPFDVIHSHSSKAGALARLAGVLIFGSRQIYTPHAFVTMAPDASRFYAWIEHFLSYFCSAIICTSEQERRHARKTLRISARKLFVVHNGVTLDYPATRADARKKLNVLEKDFVVGFIGRLVAQKNPPRAVDAFAMAASKKDDLRLVVIGEGELRPQAEALAEQRGVSSRSRFLGGVDGRDFLPGFDCLLCSSDYESFGLVLTEALAAGVAVVTTPVGIAEDVIKNGENGFVVFSFDGQSLADGLLRLSGLSPEEKHRMSQAALASSKFLGIEQMAQATRRVYMENVH